MYKIECRNLKKSFQTAGSVIHPVDGLTLQLQAGQIHSVIGESGCGKTTLLRLEDFDSFSRTKTFSMVYCAKKHCAVGEALTD